MNMKKAAMIIPYYGEFPNYFHLWIKSASYITQIDFYIFTDILDKYEFPSNIIIVKKTFDELRKQISTLFEFPIVLHKPYKLCDYRPAYGMIFNEYLKGYEFWGHCDLDIIWGNLDELLSSELFDMYDKVFCRGHLTFYRNCIKINTLFMEIGESKEINYKDAFTTKYSCHFDEGPFLDELFRIHNLRVWDKILFADIRYQEYPFRLAQPIENSKCPQIYKWDNGHLYQIYYVENTISYKEFYYIHLQKRKMEVKLKNNENTFFIFPESFERIKLITKEIILKYENSPKYFKFKTKTNRFHRIWKNILEGALKIRLLKLLRK